MAVNTNAHVRQLNVIHSRFQPLSRVHLVVQYNTVVKSNPHRSVLGQGGWYTLETIKITPTPISDSNDCPTYLITDPINIYNEYRPQRLHNVCHPRLLLNDIICVRHPIHSKHLVRTLSSYDMGSPP